MQYSFLGSFCICQGGNFDAFHACLCFAQCDLQALLFIFSRLSDELIIIAFELNSLLTVSHAQFYCLSCTIPDLMQQLSLTFNFFFAMQILPQTAAKSPSKLSKSSLTGLLHVIPSTFRFYLQFCLKRSESQNEMKFFDRSSTWRCCSVHRTLLSFYNMLKKQKQKPPQKPLQRNSKPNHCKVNDFLYLFILASGHICT